MQRLYDKVSVVVCQSSHPQSETHQVLTKTVTSSFEQLQQNPYVISLYFTGWFIGTLAFAF